MWPWVFRQASKNSFSSFVPLFWTKNIRMTAKGSVAAWEGPRDGEWKQARELGKGKGGVRDGKQAGKWRGGLWMVLGSVCQYVCVDWRKDGIGARVWGDWGLMTKEINLKLLMIWAQSKSNCTSAFDSTVSDSETGSFQVLYGQGAWHLGWRSASPWTWSVLALPISHLCSTESRQGSAGHWT